MRMISRQKKSYFWQLFILYDSKWQKVIHASKPPKSPFLRAVTEAPIFLNPKFSAFLHFNIQQDNTVSTLTNWQTTWSILLLEQLRGPQLVKKFLSFCGNRRSITAYIRAHNLSLSWARPIQSTPPFYFLKIHFNIIIPSKPRPSKWSLSLMLPIKTLYSPHRSPIRVTSPAHLNLIDVIIRTVFIAAYRSWSSSLCSLLQPRVTRPC